MGAKLAVVDGRSRQRSAPQAPTPHGAQSEHHGHQVLGTEC